MNLQEWKEAIQKSLHNLANRLRTLMPDTVYGALSAATILPVVTAMQQGDPFVVIALTNVLGSIGASLVANKIQAWKEYSEATLANELHHYAVTDQQWQQVLDRLLTEFEAQAIVQGKLSKEDQQWFLEKLSQEVDAIQSQLSIQPPAQIELNRSNNHGNVIITGYGNTVTYQQTPSIQVPTPELSPDNLSSIIQSYLNNISDHYYYLELKGMGINDRLTPRLPLLDMYVSLYARVEPLPGNRGVKLENRIWTSDLSIAGRKASRYEIDAVGRQVSQPANMLTLLQRYDGLIVLGDPGAGKTTFLKYVALCIATGQSQRLGIEFQLPLLVPLSAYANVLANQDIPLHEFIPEYYRQRSRNLPVSALKEILDQGNALFLFDGLDEIKDQCDRALVVERIVDFFSSYRRLGNKFIITSRIIGYKEIRPTVDGLVECTLVDFSEQEIECFIEKWTQALEQAASGETVGAQQDAKREQEALSLAIQRNPSIRKLASNPLLLTILALMKRQGIILPERRVELYENYLKTLLKEWNLARGLDKRYAYDLDDSATIKILAPLALWMQETSPGIGLVKEDALRNQVEKIYAGKNTVDPEQAASQFLRNMFERTSLLIERGPREYGFIHLTFQEYLAAIAITQLGQESVTPINDKLEEILDSDAWHEVILLAVAQIGLIQQREIAASNILLNLLERWTQEPGKAAILAAEIVADLWPTGVTQACKTTVVHSLQQTIHDERIKPSMRASAGTRLGILGDERLGVGTIKNCNRGYALPAIDWVLIEPGPFIMGLDTSSSTDEGPQFICHQIQQRYSLSRYPITVSQYQSFVNAGGYTERSFWTAAGWAWRKHADITSPATYSDIFQTPNHPQVGISWFEAIAFCNWLSQEFSTEIVLPSEAQWERAARHIDGRLYAWGNTYEETYCNAVGTGIGSTSAVGLFPKGNAVCGAADMCGNVLEWCRTKWVESYTDYESKVDDNDDGLVPRILRGGTFHRNQDTIRCTFRNWHDPDYRNHYIGFRICLAYTQL